jgi:flagellar assembly protein FliH
VKTPLSNTKTDTGTQNGKCEILEMESFDISHPRLAPNTRRSTFEPSYARSGDGNTFRFMPLFDDMEEDDGEDDVEEDDGEKANRIIEEAKRRTSLIESEAYEKGFAQGEKDGFEMGSRKLEKILDRILGILQDMVAYRQEFVKKYEKEMLHLIRAIAEKVVRVAVKADSQIVRQTILEAFSLAADRSEVTVRVNPQEVEFVKEIRPEFFDRISELKSITIESDPSITRGGCFMETTFGNVDARLETQLQKITKAVEHAFEEESVKSVNDDKEVS